MEILITALSTLIVVGGIYAFYLHHQKNSTAQNDQSAEKLQQSMQWMMQQLTTISTRVDERLKENYTLNERTHRTLGERLDNAAKVITGVTSKLSQLEEANKKIYEVGKDILSLQEILKTPKLRGNLGELFLGDLLSQILPREHFTLQHKFKSGVMVDAIVHLREGLLVPIDAKFPLENFKKMLDGEEQDAKKMRKIFLNDLQKHIDAIASRYILPDEGTLDFAIMYIPAENVYYEMMVKDQEEKSINDYALAKRVIPVSPNTLYIYLQAILLGLRGLQIEKGTKEILATLGQLKTDFQKFGEDFTLVGTHLSRAQNSYASSEKRLDRFKGKLEVLEIDQPIKKELPMHEA